MQLVPIDNKACKLTYFGVTKYVFWKKKFTYCQDLESACYLDLIETDSGDELKKRHLRWMWHRGAISGLGEWNGRPGEVWSTLRCFNEKVKKKKTFLRPRWSDCD